MSYLVCHVEKYKMPQVAPIGRHNNRDTDKHSNLDIDPELKPKNFYAFTGEEGNPKVSYRKRINEILKTEYKSKRKIRTDAIMMVGIVVTSDVAFFRSMSHAEIKRFFRCAATFLGNRYGMANVIDAKVHMDETTPHMHFEFCPCVDGHLSARKLFDKWKLQVLQTEFADYLKEQKFDILRGLEASGVKHIPIPQLKRETFRALHDVEVQEQIIKAIEDDTYELCEDLKGSNKYDKYKHVFENIDAFMSVHRKMVFEAAHYLRKKREFEDILARLTNEKNKLVETNRRLRDIIKAHGLSIK